MMNIIVQKFGGSSVADIEKINKVAQLISTSKKSNLQIAVVVSAMGKTTNELITLAKNISEDPPKREIDMLLSTGERITMSLLCIALHKLGIEAISLTGSQAGIITNDRHNDARVIEVRPFRVQDELAKDKVVVIGGFQGVSYKRDITTLGRGGSDTSAVALAAALNAERCEIYSDVDGVYSADPMMVREAKHLPEISHQQMQEMSFAGAKVLNSQAVQFAKENQIAVYARSTFNPEKETIIRKLASGFTKGIKAVVYETNIVRVSLFYLNDELDWLLNFLEENQIQIKELNAAEYEDENFSSKASFIISISNIYNWSNIQSSLSIRMKNKIKFDFNFAALSLIGEGINQDNSILIETKKMLSENGIKTYGITTTSFRLSILVESNFINQAVILCHKKWIE